MVEVHREKRAAPVRRPRAKRIVLRAEADRAPRPGGEVTEVVVSAPSYRRLADKAGPIGRLLADYADTLARAEREGREVSLTIQVSPDGTATPASAPAAADALEAALAAARARGDAKVAELLKGEDMLTGRDFGALIGASHETVNAKRRRFEVLGLEGATRGVRYPRWQVTDQGLPLPGLARLFEALGDHPWTVHRFLRTVHPELGGRTALDALKAGQVEPVLGAARNQVAGVFA